MIAMIGIFSCKTQNRIQLGILLSFRVRLLMPNWMIKEAYQVEDASLIISGKKVKTNGIGTPNVD